MVTDFITRIFTSKLSKIVLGLFVLGVAMTQVAPHMVDTKPYVERMSVAVREASGAALMVKGGSQLQVIPRPAIVLRNIEITQANVAHAPSVSVDVAEVGIDVMSLFSAAPRAGSLRMAGLVASIEQAEGNAAEWGFLGLPLLKIMAAKTPQKPIVIEVLSGRISLADVKTGASRSITGIEAAGTWGENTAISGVAQVEKIPLRFSATRGGVVGATPITLSVSSKTGDKFSLAGNMDFTSDHPVITAKLEAAFANVAELGAPPVVDANSALDVVSNQSTEADKTQQAMPLSLTADYTQKEGALSLSNLTLEGWNSKASGALEWNLNDSKDHTLTLAFSTLDATALRSLFALYLQQNEADTEGRNGKTLVAKEVDLTLNMTAEKIASGAQQWNDATFNGVIAEGNLTVNKLALGLPGDSVVAVFGQISVNETQGLRFEGNIEAEGKSLREALTVFDESAANLPVLGFGAYKLRSNLFISSELLRLSEADAKFSELSLKGGLVGYFDKSKPRIEAEIGLRDIDFDYFRNSWRSNSSPENDDVFLRFDRGMNFDWLKKLAASIDFKIAVQEFKFLERSGKNASLRLFAQAGELGVYNAKFDYGNDVTEANLKLDVTRDEPNLNLVLNTRTLNTNYFARVPLSPERVKPVVPEIKLEEKLSEPLPEMTMPEATPEEELRAKIAEEAKELDGAGEAAMPAAIVPDAGAPVELMPLVEGDSYEVITTEPQAGEITKEDRFPQEVVDMRFMEGIGGSFDISVGTLTHRGRMFQNFKMLAKLERNLLTFQTLTFGYFGGSFSINGTVFGGKVPGLSLGFIIASADLNQVLETLLNNNAIGGRVSISGTVDTSGVDLHSWVEQANAKLTFAARGLTIRGFDVASVVTSVNASRTAADVFNNVNLSLTQGAGEYSADGAINLQKAVVSTPGIALNTGRIVGNATGDFELLPWEVNMTGVFKFPELSAENVPTMTVQISGAPEHLNLQTDTQSLEALVSKRIIGD